MRVLHGILILLFLCAGVPAAAATETYALTGQIWFEGQSNSGGIATDEAGNVYVTTRLNKVQKFSPSGTLLMTLGGNGPGLFGSGTEFGQFDKPLGVAVDGSGTIYVADSGNHRVQKFNAAGGFVTAWGESGPGPGQFFKYLPGIGVDRHGNVFTVDRDFNGHQRVQKFTSTGGFITSWDPPADATYIAIDSADQVYVSTQQGVLVYTPTGALVRSLGAGTYMCGVTVDGADNVYAGEKSQRRIRKFTSSGAEITQWGIAPDDAWGFPGPLDLAADSAGIVYALDDSANRVLQFSPLEPRFTASPVMGLNPLTVQFTDTSPGTPTSWSWDFGDGHTSATQSPSHAYANAGTYSVTLTVTYPGGITKSVTKTNLVNVFQSLHAAYTVGSRIGYAPYTAVFTDQTTGTPTSWHWEFGDGQTSTAKNPVHTYATRGNYTVRLTVSNPYDTKTATKADYIRVLALWNGLIRTEAEDYDYDYPTEGVGYHDITPGNSGGAYRNDDVDITPISTIMKFGYVVTNTAEGEWTRYWVTSPAAVEYDYPLSLRVAGWAAGQTITATVVGMTGSIDISVPNTGSATSYTIVNTMLRLGPGMNIVRFTYHGCAMNFDYFTLDPSGIPVVTPTPTPWPVLTIPGGSGLPTWITVAGKYDDVNGNGRKDFADVVLYFNQMTWIAANEPVEGFDYNGNRRIDFADVVALFNAL